MIARLHSRIDSRPEGCNLIGARLRVPHGALTFTEFRNLFTPRRSVRIDAA